MPNFANCNTRFKNLLCAHGPAIDILKETIELCDALGVLQKFPIERLVPNPEVRLSEKDTWIKVLRNIVNSLEYLDVLISLGAKELREPTGEETSAFNRVKFPLFEDNSVFWHHEKITREHLDKLADSQETAMGKVIQEILESLKKSLKGYLHIPLGEEYVKDPIAHSFEV